ncbi:hypothetical protein RFM26_12040 [Mesorhizobium sp. VK23B]|uniref:Uncharacterized protein n=1 Tax=Mesorhizobium dulcispinae TaxID=3072316 RepID=A0ABU4XFB2_9HYPH|nr:MULTISPECIES: hypothetical protein [unclassified Mesorhizobium]MDX8466414.1 hypothetical protein [Mesorhizobium sp. VK23B]MDX8472224.1 hypothetical protein [Mesorhizobium sp. VK23A]MDX8521577.1 hypothetical protein [Mesorhizobium sp. VK23D]
MSEQNGEEIEDQGLHLDLAFAETKGAGILVKLEVAETINSHRQLPP